MAVKYLLPQSPLLDGDAVISATSEAGLILAPPVDLTSVGTLHIKASGFPDVSQDITIRAQLSGTPDGFAPNLQTGSGVSVLYKDTADADALYNGFLARQYVSWSDCPPKETPVANSQWGWPSAIRETRSGRAIFAVYRTVALSDDRIISYFKAGPRDEWTASTIFLDGTAGITLSQQFHAVGLIRRPEDNTLICYFFAEPSFGTGGQRIVSYSSTNEGTTWTLLEKQVYEHNDTAFDIIRAEFTDDDGAIFLGKKTSADVRSLFSRSAGLRYGQIGNDNTTYFRPITTVMKSGAILIMVDDDSADAFQQTVAPGVNLDDDAGWVDTQNVTKQVVSCVVTDDDGTVWLFDNAITGGATAMAMYGSADEGLTWTELTEPPIMDSAHVFNPAAGVVAYLDGIQAGPWGGNLTMVGTSIVPTATDGQLIALNWGGWTPTVTDVPNGIENGEGYAFAYIPTELPNLVNWSAPSTSGATTLTNGILQIVNTGIGHDEYKSSATMTDPGGVTGFRCRFIWRCPAGAEDMTDDRQVVHIRVEGASFDQWVTFRMGDDNVRLVDAGGTLATTSNGVGTGFFATLYTEVLISLELNAGAGANTGLVSCWYRRSDAQEWIAFVVASDVTGVANVPNSQFIHFGGMANGALTAQFKLLEFSQDSGGLAPGQTAPDDLTGRAIGSIDAFLRTEVAIGGFGGAAVSGDTWQLKTEGTFGADFLVTTASPSRTWRSTTTGGGGNIPQNRIVFDATADGVWQGDTVILAGTNMRTAKLEFNATDAWGGPSTTVTLDATVASFSVSSGAQFGDGFITDTGATFVPHAYASKPGRRFWVEIDNSGNVYEIDDNTTDRLIIKNAGISGESATTTVRIFGDAMWATFTEENSRRYMALTIDAAETAATYFEVGRLQFGMATEMNSTKCNSRYRFGFTDTRAQNTDLLTGTNGQRFGERLGPSREELTISWDGVNRLSTDWELELDALIQYGDGSVEVLGFVRDSATTSMHLNGGIYRVIGNLDRRNERGEGTDALTSMTGIVLSEEL